MATAAPSSIDDDPFRRMSDAELIDQTLAGGQAGVGVDQRSRSARAQAELTRREREHQINLAAEQRRIAEAQVEVAKAAAQSAADSARATRGLVYLGIFTVVIGIAATAFAGLQWLTARDQPFLAMKPHADFDIEDDPDEPIVGIGITNAGPGPATIKAVKFYVDRKPVADADEMGRTYAKLSAAELDYQIMEPGDTLAVGDRVWLISYRKPRGGKVNQANKAAFADFLEKSAAIKIEFCSVIRQSECWPKCSDKGRCG